MRQVNPFPVLCTMKYVFVLLLAMVSIPNSGSAQKVFSVDGAYQADVKIFVVDAAYQADLLVFKVDAAYQADGNEGLWFFVDAAYQADKNVFFVEHAYQADLLIYFVDAKYQAKWEASEKIHIMY